ncbi:hypothetical protein HMPREF9154_0358 [Arachnia propionica F0230a]|nr:hypothetical protein HMPREF9154_0358 [Arachnia propionica F0230a]
MPSPALQSWFSRPATKELVVSKPWWLGSGGFDSGRSFLTTRLNRLGGGEVG